VSRIYFDDLDRRIVAELSQDARVSNRQIAADLGVGEATIRTRLRRLQNQRLMQFTALTDFRMVGSPTLVIFGIHCEPARVTGVAAELAALDSLNCVMVLLGRFSVLATGLFTSMTDVEDVKRERIAKIRGIRQVETIVSMQQFKYDFRMAHILKPTTPQGARRRASRVRPTESPVRR
jgi:Lrp/AsnC family transcriptional regulator, regulator for asnA, asnC and gidA